MSRRFIEEGRRLDRTVIGSCFLKNALLHSEMTFTIYNHKETKQQWQTTNASNASIDALPEIIFLHLSSVIKCSPKRPIGCMSDPIDRSIDFAVAEMTFDDTLTSFTLHQQTLQHNDAT